MEASAAPALSPADSPGDKKAAPAGDKKKGGAGKGGAGAGLTLGKGTTVLRAAVEAAAATAAASDGGGAVSVGSATTIPVSPVVQPQPPADGAAAAPARFALRSDSAAEQAWQGCRAALAPLGAACGKLIEEIKAVVEANQVGT